MNKGFADLCLTTWLRRRKASMNDEGGRMKQRPAKKAGSFVLHPSAFIIKELWSGRRDLNSRLRPWQGRTLPLSYSRSGFNYKQAALVLSAVANRYWCPAPPFSSFSLARAVI